MKNIEYDIPIFESNDLADLDLYSEKMATAIKGQIDKITTNVDGKVTEIQDNIEEINKKDTEQDNKIVELQNEKIELEKELKEIQEDFYQSSIRGQASGEYIHVEDSSGARCKIGIGGNHKQEIYSGKNKYLLPNEQTINGIKVSHNKDGTFNLIGTATAETFITVSTTNILNDKKVYTISKNTTNVGMAGYEYNINTWLQTFVSIGKSEKSKTFTYNKNSNMTRNVLQINIANGTVLNETNIKIMLEENSNETEWEPYVGGIPAPNPDYPSEIKTVGSNVNIFDCSKGRHEGTYNGINIRYENGYLVLNGTSTNVVDIYLCYSGLNDELLNHLNNNYGKYTLSNNLGFENYIQTTSGYKNNVADITENDKAIRAFVRMPSQKTYSNEILKIKLVEGTEVGEYSKYGQGSVKVTKCNKNWFNVEDWVKRGNNSTYYSYEDGEISINKLDDRQISKFTQNERIYLPNGNYVISGTENVGVRVYNDDTDYPLLTNNFEVKLGYIYLKLVSSSIVKCKPMIKLESVADNTYELHQEQSYIIPAQREMLEGDYFDWDNEEEVHVWKKRILDGNETFAISGNVNDIYQFNITLTDKGDFIDDTVSIKAISNYFEGVPWDQSWNKNNTIVTSYSKNIRIMTSKYTTVEQFKTWLKSRYDEGTPVIVYYKLSTPTCLPFTEEQKEIAKELSNARTYKNVTNIYTTDEVSPIIELDYAKDLETLINNVQALALSNVNEEV